MASEIPPVVGINFGNAYASIAVFTKEGLAESIANEDGERQIASAIAFQGEEMYIGNQAKQQLVKNAENTIVGFRNFVGKKFSEIPASARAGLTCAPVIEHPDLPDTPAYKVEVLAPAPAPIKTPLSSAAATPRSEPTMTTRILSVAEVTTIFMQSLIASAEAFLGKSIHGAVITVPPTFGAAQVDALGTAVAQAGVRVLQFVDEAGAVVAASPADQDDRTQLIVDLGLSSLSLTLLSSRAGLAHVLAASSTESIGASHIDDALIAFFAKDFTKKTKIPLILSAQNQEQSVADRRAEARLRLAIEHTKRTLSASPGAATCSVESLKDGYDYTGSINRMRFDLLAGGVYAAVVSAVGALLESTKVGGGGGGVDACEVDEIVYVGGTACLPGLNDALLASTALALDEDVRVSVDPTTLLARGCAMQAALIAQLELGEGDEELVKAFAFGRGGDGEGQGEGQGEGEGMGEVLARTLALFFPSDTNTNTNTNPNSGEEGQGGTLIPVILKETPLPARRSVHLDVALAPSPSPSSPSSNSNSASSNSTPSPLSNSASSASASLMAVELWEVDETVRLETITNPPDPDDSEEEEEEEEGGEEVVKHKEVRRVALLGAAVGEARLGIRPIGNKNASASASAGAGAKGAKGDGKSESTTKGDNAGDKEGESTTTVEATVEVGADGKVRVRVAEVGVGGCVLVIEV